VSKAAFICFTEGEADRIYRMLLELHAALSLEEDDDPDTEDALLEAEYFMDRIAVHFNKEATP
jgi:hypothetical protein